MTASQARRGRTREGDVVRILTLGGWVAIRAASGPVDVVAVGHNVTFFPGIGEGRWAAPRPLLVQVKSTSRPYERFGPEDRDVLRELSWKAGCEAWLVHWPARGRPTWVHETDWPKRISSSDWGATWTAAEVNDPGFGGAEGVGNLPITRDNPHTSG